MLKTMSAKEQGDLMQQCADDKVKLNEEHLKEVSDFKTTHTKDIDSLSASADIIHSKEKGEF